VVVVLVVVEKGHHSVSRDLCKFQILYDGLNACMHACMHCIHPSIHTYI